MRQLLLYIILSLFACSTQAQNLDVDMKRDLYAEVPTIDMSMLDTIVLKPFNGVYDHSKDVFVWHYLSDDNYQLRIFNNSMPGITDPYVFAPERWKMRGDDSVLYLTVKEHRKSRMFHSKIATYRLYPYRDTYNILYKVVMVKQYDNRYMQPIKPPTIMH